MSNAFIIEKEVIKDTYKPVPVEGNPVYSPSVLDEVLYDKDCDGNVMLCDTTQILLNQEKYRRLLGDMNLNEILSQMHPTPTTAMDNMTDEQRFECVISRHCQTMSERQAVLSKLASEHSQLSEYAKALIAEETASPAPAASASADAQ